MDAMLPARLLQNGTWALWNKVLKLRNETSAYQNVISALQEKVSALRLGSAMLRYGFVSKEAKLSVLSKLRVLSIALVFSFFCLSSGFISVPASAETGEQSFSLASTLIQEGQYGPAEHLLSQVIQANGDGSVLGQNAAYMLMSAYGCEGRYMDALQTASKLLQSIKLSRTQPADFNRDEILAQQQVYQAALGKEAQIQSRLRDTRDPAAVLALRGTLDDIRLRPQDAMNEYRAAYRSLMHEPHAPPEVRLLVEKSFLMRLSRISGLKPGEREQIAVLYSHRILTDPTSSPAQQHLALSLVDNILLEPALKFSLANEMGTPFPPEVSSVKEDLEALARLPVPAGSPSAQAQGAKVHQWADDLRQRMAEHETNQLLGKAVAAEKASDWTGAAEAYENVIQHAGTISDPAQQWGLARVVSQAKRSLLLMKSLSWLPANSGDPFQSAASATAFLGIDRTIGGDWRGVLGTEAWTLFAVHGDDLCGGPRLLDGSFSYRIHGGDPDNQPRRWRDPAGYNNAPAADLPLVDPAVSGERVISFLDDNGEGYAPGAGPDLYLDLTIPAGRHLLSMPLHFSAPENQSASYGLYLLASSATDTPPCLASSIVSIKDAPGYVRLAVHGPAHYTLVVRRLTAFNANIPAVFLDPDLRDVRPPSLSEELPNASKLASTSLASNTSLTDSEIAFQKMTTEYEAGAGSASDTGRTSISTSSSAAPVADAAPVDWLSLNKTATALSRDVALTPEQRLVAALVVWRSEERLPLQAGKLTSAFSRFLALRFPQAGLSQDNFHLQLDALLSLSQQMRLLGRIPFAEMADDAAWNTQVQLALLANPTNLTTDRQQQNTLLRQLWQSGPSQYLDDQTAWIWQGDEGPAPQPIHLALDASYAAQKAGLAIGALIAPEPLTAMLVEPNNRSTSASVNTSAPALFTAVDAQPAGTLAAPAKDVSNTMSVSSRSASGNTTVLSDKTMILPDSVSLQLARIWIDEFKSNALTRQSQSDGALRQPVDLIVYIGACQPLLEPFLSKSSEKHKDGSVQGNDKAHLYSASLLRADQMQSLANALINRNLFPSEHQAQERAEAVSLLEMIQVLDPRYPQISEVNAMLAFLKPSLQPAK